MNVISNKIQIEISLLEAKEAMRGWDIFKVPTSFIAFTSTTAEAVFCTNADKDYVWQTSQWLKMT